jgi:hypothetical protein
MPSNKKNGLSLINLEKMKASQAYHSMKTKTKRQSVFSHFHVVHLENTKEKL